MKKNRAISLILVIFLVMTTFGMISSSYAASNPGAYTFDISEGSILVEAGSTANTLKVTYGASITTADFADTQMITIIGSNTNNYQVAVDGVTASVTLSSISIVTYDENECAFDLRNNAEVSLTLNGTNVLTSGAYMAGLQVPTGSSVTLAGAGTLNATGGFYGAGIGGGFVMVDPMNNIGTGIGCGTVIINSGTINARAGGDFGAGIGGGREGTGGIITIMAAATVNAAAMGLDVPAIQTASGSLEAASTARVMMANLKNTLEMHTGAEMRKKSDNSSGGWIQAYWGTGSVAMTATQDTWYLFFAGFDLYQHTAGAGGADFVVPASTGFTIFNDVEPAPYSADLVSLTFSTAVTGYSFVGSTYTYSGLTVPNAIASLTITPVGAGTITVAGTTLGTVTVISGQPSASIALSAGISKTITVIETEVGKSRRVYTLYVTRANADQAAPAGLAGTAPSVFGASDGKITGTATTMEYKPSASGSYTTCMATETTGLAAGNYDVRYKAAAGLNAGTPATVTIAEGVTPGDLNQDGYYDNDFEKIQDFLDLTSVNPAKSNGEFLDAGYLSADPTTWPGLTWSASSPKRIEVISWTKPFEQVMGVATEGMQGTLDISDATALINLSCYDNRLTAVDVSGDSALTILNIQNNLLTNLTLSGNTMLETLCCSGNALTTIDFSAIPSLEYLYANNNSLQTLDVSTCVNLLQLQCAVNELTSLTVNGANALIDIECSVNNLTVLNVSELTDLEYLYCGGNNLSALNLSTNTQLGGLNCSFNQITALDLSTNTALYVLDVRGNLLSSLDLWAVTELDVLKTAGNPLTILKVSFWAHQFDLRAFGGYVNASNNFGTILFNAVQANADVPFINWWNSDTAILSTEPELEISWVGSDPEYAGPVYAWSAHFFNTVTFDSQGGSSVDAICNYTVAPIPAPEDPTRGVYTFAGWYTEAACETPWDFDTAVSINRTLYAKWVAPVLTGTAAISGTTTYGSTLTATLAEGNNSGTLFYCWLRGSSPIDGATASSYTLTANDIGATIKVEISSSVETGSLSSNATAVVTKAESTPATGATPVLASKTTVKITLLTVAGYQYLLVANGAPATGTWQDSPIFSGLSSSTAYDCYQRVKETATHQASAISAKLDVTTSAVPITTPTPTPTPTPTAPTETTPVMTSTTPTPTPTPAPTPTETVTTETTTTPSTTPEETTTSVTAINITPNNIDKNEATGIFTITINVKDLPEGTTAIQSKNGTVVYLNGSDTVEMQVFAAELDVNGKLQFTTINDQEIPIGLFDLQIEQTGGTLPAYLWIIIIVVIILAAGLIIFLIIRKKRGY